MQKLIGWKRDSGLAVFILCLAAIAAPAQTFTTLHNFTSIDGANPFAGLVQGLNGSLYGATYAGGTGSQCAAACGTIFEITPGGSLTTLYNFCSQTSCTDGAGPVGTLVLATNGDFYGTTKWGGAYDSGTVFRITPSGVLTTLYSFCSLANCTDGGNPTAGLVEAANGAFYGTTYYSGNNQACGGGCGTIFKITAAGQLTTIHIFDGTDGAGPAALIRASDSNFYGTTYQGGSIGDGTVFRISLNGTFTSLFSFDSSNGSLPYPGLVQGKDGRLYGTTASGGINDEGTAFKITTRGTLTTLFNFCACVYGSEPLAALTQATDGNFYGSTFDSGPGGTLLQISSAGSVTTLYTFCLVSGCPDGAYLYGPLVQATNGTFYGTAHSGGSNGDGTVFSLTVGLKSFVEAIPGSGKVGTSITILGTNLTGATKVTFNGTAATFKVVSASEIKTTVPSGAATGKIQVTTPTGAFFSNVAFMVTP